MRRGVINGFGSLASSQGQPTTLCLGKEKFPCQTQPAFCLPCAEHSRVKRLLHGAVPGDTACARGVASAAASTPSLMLGLPKLSHPHQLLRAAWSRAGSVCMLGLCCPPLGQLGLSVGNSRLPGLRSTALQIFDVPVQRDFRATLPGICSPLAWPEVLDWRSFVACAPFVAGLLALVSVLSALFQALVPLGSPRIAESSASSPRSSTS